MKEVGFLVVFGKCLIPFEEEQGCTRINILISLGPYMDFKNFAERES